MKSLSLILSGTAKVLCAYQGVPAPFNGRTALPLELDETIDVLSTDDSFWWEVSIDMMLLEARQPLFLQLFMWSHVK
jgi:hypothetical protein